MFQQSCKRHLGFILFFSVFLTTQACTKKVDDEKHIVFHGSIKDDVKTWDPANAYDSVSSDLLPSIYESLYQYSYLSEVYQVEPLLAAGMPKVSKDRLTLTIPLKKGVRFQDDPCFKASQGKGRELKAQDFIYAWKRLALPSIQSVGWWIFDGQVLGINAFHDKLAKASKEELPKVFEEPVEGIQALDDYTIQIKFNKPCPAILYFLTMGFTAPVPHEAIESYADDRGNLIDHPIGTGPYKLAKWDRSHQVILDKNPNFRGESYPKSGSLAMRRPELLEDAGKTMPFIDVVAIDVVKEAQPRWLNFLKGNMDIIRLPKDNFKQAIFNQVNLSPELVKKGVHLSITPGVTIRYLSFNVKDKVLSNKYLRQALSSSIDRDKWIEIFNNGTGKKMVNAIPYGLADRPKTNKIKYDFNLEKAKSLLAKAGYPNGEGLPVLRFDLRGASTTDRQIGDFIQNQFAQIGVKTEVIANTFPAFLTKRHEGNLQISYGGWQLDYPDVENIYQLAYGPNETPGPNDANYTNPQMDRLYSQMETMDPGKRRADLVQKMDDLLQEDCPWAFGYYETDYDLTQPWFLNYRGTDIILNKYKYFRINKDLKTRYLEER